MNIILSAMDEFGRSGYQGASMDEISRRAGITKGALYWHFEGKLDLYLAVFDHAMEEYSRSLEKAMASSSEPRTVLEDLATCIFSIYAEDTAVSRFYSSMMMDSKLMGEADIASKTEQIYSEYRKAITNIIENWDVAKKFNGAKLRAASISYIALIEGTALQWMLDKDSFELEREGPQGVELLLDGIEMAIRG